MAALALQLEIQGGSGNFTFLVPPTFEPQVEPVWKRASNPQVIEELRWSWDFAGAVLVATDGTVATLWSEWLAFIARFQTRGSQPTYARITRDPAGSNTVVWTLGPSTHEQLRFDSIRAGRSGARPGVDHGAWRVAIPVDLTISAVQKLPEAVTGIVGWDQRVSYTYDEGGLQIVEWRTRITTAEGTDAVAKARTYGLIPIAVYGDSYSYLTNGDDGVEVEVEDADEQNSRTPTIAVGICRLKQWGLPIGATGPGLSPSTVSFTRIVEVEDEERTYTFTARAVGPGAEGWVTARRPAGVAITSYRTSHEEASRVFEATWVQKLKSTKAGGLTTTIAVTITGGHPAYEYEEAVGGLPPVEFETGVTPWTVTVGVKVEALGAGGGTNATMLLPPIIETQTGMRLDRAASEEGEAFISKHADNPGATEWTREARLVYRSAVKPNADQIRPLLEVETGRVASYYL